MVKRFADKARLYNDIATDWEGDPISLDKPEPPSFGEEDFPPGLWDKLKAVSQALEVPIELPATQGLAVLAAACQKRFVIQVEPGYTEPLNLWPCCALEPANRKSPSLKNMAAPLASWEIDRSRDMGPEIERCTLEYKAQSARLKKLEKDYGAADDPAEREKIFATLSELSKSIKPIPMPPQIFTQDTSPEKLAVLLENNHEKMAIFSAEGGIFDIISGRYSNGMPNLDIFLQAHSGDAVRVDRVGRSGVYLKEPALTMGLSPQPDVIRSLADRQGFKGRGFIARFLFALPRSNVGQRTLEPKPLSAYVEEQYARTIRALLDYVNEVPLIIHLSQKAYDSWKTFQLTVEMEMGENGDLAGMKDFGGKLPGAAARIAGLFHCYIHAHNGPQVERVSFATMSAALSLAGKLSAHTRTVYDLMGVDPDIEDARRMLNWIVKESKHRFTLRECHRALQGSFSRKEALEPALKVLTERGYIRLMARPSTQGPGRPSIIYEVHPLIIRK
ncbi:MAG: hypothetical protein VR64_22270 [Desulfatitalea sp. BRH_c12]|nr:MAG: hypothetical protein VR64_22270 [Desulfatitalea sp. BRH_c12]